MSDAVALLHLPRARLTLRGDVASETIDELTDLTDPRLHEGPGAPHLHLDVRWTGQTFELSQPSDDTHFVTGRATADDPGDLLDLLVSRCNLAAFDTDPRRLHLHAAVVEFAGYGVLIAGTSGSGKTSLTLELMRRGAAYLTDECATLCPGSRTVYAYPKPISVKPGSPSDLHGCGLPSRSTGRTHVRASRLGETLPWTAVDTIVFVRYSRTMPPSVQHITSAEACVRLLADSLDGSRYGDAALNCVAQLTAHATAWEIIHQGADWAADRVVERCVERREPAVASFLAMALEPLPGVGSLRSPHLATTGLKVVRFDDGAAVYDIGSKKMQVLDRAQFESLDDPDAWDGAQALGRRAFAPMAELLGGQPVLRASHDTAPLSFGLPGRPPGAFTRARPLDTGDIRSASTIALTTLLVEQANRGRTAASREVADLVLAESERLADHDRLIAEALTETEAALALADIEPILVGQIVSRVDGGNPTLSGDPTHLDLLVDPALVETGTRVLARAGFSPSLNAAVTGRATVMLHSSLVSGPLGAWASFGEVRAWSVPIRVGENWYLAAHPVHRFVHACAALDAAGTRSTLADVRAVVMLAPVGAIGGEWSVEAAEALRMSAVVRAAVLHCDDLIPGALDERLVTLWKGIRPAPDERWYARYARSQGLLSGYTLGMLAGHRWVPKLRVSDWFR